MTINSKTKLLIISPHPDDEAISCGGLIGKCKKEGAKIKIIYACVGNSRQLITKNTNTNTRLEEIKSVEKFLSEKTEIFYIGDEFTKLDMVPQKDMIEKIEDVMESFKPTIMVIPSSTSYNQDHLELFKACITALRPTPKEARYYVPNVLEFFEPYDWGINTKKTPNVFIDLNQIYNKQTLLDFKINLYKCHKTQVRKDPHSRSIENLKRIAAIQGIESGMVLAEAYHLLRTTIY